MVRKYFVPDALDSTHCSGQVGGRKLYPDCAVDVFHVGHKNGLYPVLERRSMKVLYYADNRAFGKAAPNIHFFIQYIFRPREP